MMTDGKQRRNPAFLTDAVSLFLLISFQFERQNENIHWHTWYTFSFLQSLGHISQHLVHFFRTLHTVLLTNSDLNREVTSLFLTDSHFNTAVTVFWNVTHSSWNYGSISRNSTHKTTQHTQHAKHHIFLAKANTSFKTIWTLLKWYFCVITLHTNQSYPIITNYTQS